MDAAVVEVLVSRSPSVGEGAMSFVCDMVKLVRLHSNAIKEGLVNRRRGWREIKESRKSKKQRERRQMVSIGGRSCYCVGEQDMCRGIRNKGRNVLKDNLGNLRSLEMKSGMT